MDNTIKRSYQMEIWKDDLVLQIQFDFLSHRFYLFFSISNALCTSLQQALHYYYDLARTESDVYHQPALKHSLSKVYVKLPSCKWI
jgi:hypothetical protein